MADRKPPKFHNKAKQAYADKFLAWVEAGEQGPEPVRGELSTMGAQSVRMAIYEYVAICSGRA